MSRLKLTGNPTANGGNTIIASMTSELTARNGKKRDRFHLTYGIPPILPLVMT